MVSQLNVKVVRATALQGEGLQLSVSLCSHNRPGLKAESHQFIAKGDPFDKMRKLAEASGGALAEYLNDTYGEKHDPAECAATALECLDRMIAEYNQNGRLQEQTVTS